MLQQHAHNPARQKGIAGLPKELWGYFWDYPHDRLSLENDHHTIVLRLLQVGGLDAIRWFRSSVDEDFLRSLLIRRKGRGIDPKRLRFWGLMLDLPRKEVDAWIAAQRDNPWYNRTKR